MKWKKGYTPEGARLFKKGQSGNPEGRPAGTENSSTRLKRLLSCEIEALNELTGIKEKLTALELMDIVMIQKALKGCLKSYAELLNRLEGKPTERQELISGDKKIIVNLIECETTNPKYDRETIKENDTEERGTICS